MRIFKNRWFERFARKNGIDNLLLKDAVERAEKGLIDADLGMGVIKQRIARQGQGRSHGFRSIILFMVGKKAFFVYGFPKNQRDSISQAEEQEFKNMAKHFLSLSENHLNLLLEREDFVEIKSNDQEIP